MMVWHNIDFRDSGRLPGIVCEPEVLKASASNSVQHNPDLAVFIDSQVAEGQVRPAAGLSQLTERARDQQPRLRVAMDAVVCKQAQRSGRLAGRRCWAVQPDTRCT